MASFQLSDGSTIEIEPALYQDNDRLAIRLNEGGEPYATLTVNVPEVPLEPDEFLVKVWSENELFIEDARKCGIFVDTGKRVDVGRCQAEVWRLANGVKL